MTIIPSVLPVSPSPLQIWAFWAGGRDMKSTLRTDSADASDWTFPSTPTISYSHTMFRYFSIFISSRDMSDTGNVHAQKELENFKVMKWRGVDYEILYKRNHDNNT